MHNLRLSSFLILMLCACLSGVIYGKGVREVENFDWNWRFSRFGLQPDGSRKEEPAGIAAPQYDDSSWRQLDLPHDWGVEGPFRTDLEGFTGKLPWRGIGWYRKPFHIPAEDAGKKFYLDFDGAMAHAEVWVNGKKAGGHPYGYSSFRVDLSPYIVPGADNVVAVRLDTERIGSRWYPGAGIYRHVRMIKTNPLHVAHWGAFVKTPEISADKAQANVIVKIDNNLPRIVHPEFSVSIYELDNDDKTGRKVAVSDKRRVSVMPGQSAEDSVSLHIPSPKLWSLEETNRYLAKVSVYDGKRLVDLYEVPFGIRTVEFTHDDGLHLNGRRVQIQGVCNHHDLGALGAAMNKTALQRQLSILKSFGCNAIRTCLLYTSPSPRDPKTSRMPSSA